MASIVIPGDMEFINMKIQARRPDGKPPVPIWVATEENMVCLYNSSSFFLFFFFTFFRPIDHPSLCPSILPPVCLTVCLSGWLAVCPFVRPSLHPSSQPAVHTRPPIGRFVHSKQPQLRVGVICY